MVNFSEKDKKPQLKEKLQAEQTKLLLLYKEVHEDLVIQVNSDSVMRRRGPVEGVASFNSTNGEFLIPLLEVNSGNEVLVARNVIFKLTNTSPVEFTLESFEQ